MSLLSEALEEYRLVIAIDYGTTHTGVAFATPAGSRAYLNEIDVVTDWGNGMCNHSKIPSVISYSLASEDEEEQWGLSLSPDAVAMVHTKLELEICSVSEELDFILEALDGMCNLHFQYVRNSGGLPPYTWRRPEEIVEDYLAKVFGAFLETMNGLPRGFPKALRDRIAVDIVATIPPGWSYRAKNSIFRALTRAGFNKDNFPKLADILLVSEPEAAAVYTATYLKEVYGADFLKKGEFFILCDCGGGTIDVISYQVKEVHPAFELEAATPATGRQAGSIFIDLAFKEWLKKLLGHHYHRLDQAELVHKIGSHYTEGPRMRDLMNKFDRWKKRFNKEHEDIRITLPKPLQNLNIDEKVVEGEIIITNNDMRGFFKPCIKDIIELIDNQITMIHMQGRNPRSVFLVGDFAEYEYLQQKIRDSLELRNIQLRRPDTSWTAVVRGAAIFGIEKSIRRDVSTIACPRNCGFSASKHSLEAGHSHRGYTGDPLIENAMAEEQLIWLIRKGDLIQSNKPREIDRPFTIYFSEDSIRRGEIPIFACDDDDELPERFDVAQNGKSMFSGYCAMLHRVSVLSLVRTLEYDLTDIPLQEFALQKRSKKDPMVYAMSLRLKMTLGPQLLKAELCWKDRTLDRADIDLWVNPEDPLTNEQNPFM